MSERRSDRPSLRQNLGRIIEVSNLTKDFGNRRAVDGLSFFVNEGEIFGLLASNQGGKTTALRTIIGLEKPSQGETAIFGNNSRHLGQDKARIGYFQVGILDHHQTVREELEFYGFAYGLRKEIVKSRVQELLKDFGLLNQTNVQIGKLSLEDQHRVAFARAILHEPELLLLDEPTPTTIKHDLRNMIWSKICEFKEKGRTTLVATNRMDDAKRCDRICVLYGGRKVIVGHGKSSHDFSNQILYDLSPSSGMTERRNVPGFFIEISELDTDFPEVRNQYENSGSTIIPGTAYVNYAVDFDFVVTKSAS